LTPNSRINSNWTAKLTPMISNPQPTNIGLVRVGGNSARPNRKKV
jgi:hypothetical protein